MPELKKILLPDQSVLLYGYSYKFKTSFLRTDLIYGGDWKKQLLCRNLFYVMARSTEKYPTIGDINKRSDDLYSVNMYLHSDTGASFDLIGYTTEMLAQDYISDHTDILSGSIELLNQTMFHPKKDDHGELSKKYCNQTIQNSVRRIKNIPSDPKAMAEENFWNIIDENNPYSSKGKFRIASEFLNSVTPHDLLNSFTDLQSSSSNLYAYYGTESEGKVVEKLLTGFPRSSSPFSLNRYSFNWKLRLNEPVRRSSETDFTQSWMIMAFSFSPVITEEERAALVVLDALLGSSPNSRLYREVRERNGLCYSIDSFYYFTRNMLTVSCALKRESVDEAEELINRQLDAIKKGPIPDEELNSVKQILENDYLATYDAPDSILDFAIGQELRGTNRTVSELIGDIRAVTADQIISLANRLKPEIVYTQYGRKGDLN